MPSLPILPPSAIDARWLTDVLQANGVDAIVEDVAKKNVGTGQIGDSVRFALSYERDAANAPRSLVGKFPSQDERSRGTGVMLKNYYREVRFYQQLAPRARIHTPRVWRADINDAHDFVLIMEDLAPAEQGDQLQGVSLAQAELALDEAAKLHASCWDDPALDTMDFVSGSKASEAGGAGAVNAEMVRTIWDGFKQRYADRLGAESVAVGDVLSARYGDQAHLHPGPRCLAHNDYRPDNMMFATARGGHAFTMLDWQTYAYGVGAVDIAYFLAGALSPQTRRAEEDRLLRRYHAALEAGGVKGYDFAALKHDYRTGAFHLFFTAFFAAMVVVQTKRGDDMFMQMLRAATDHIVDHDALAALTAV